MGEWAPVAAGFGFLVLVVLAARFLPHGWLAADLSRWYGVRPRGAFFTFTRGDQLRRALWSLVASAVLIGTVFVLYATVARRETGSTGDLIFQAYTFIGMILGCVAALAALLALLAAVFWRPRRIRSSAHALADFAQYLSLMAAGELPAEYWRDFAAVRFDDPEAEDVRQGFAAHIGAAPRELTDAEAVMVRNWAGRLR